MKKTFLFTAFGKTMKVTNQNTSSENDFISETSEDFDQTIIDNIETKEKIFSSEEMDILCKESSVEFRKRLQLLEDESLEQDDVFIGRRGHALDFFDEYQHELVKYAKTKGIVEDTKLFYESIKNFLEKEGVFLEFPYLGRGMDKEFKK